LVLLLRPEECDDASLRALRSLLLGGEAAGWAIVVTSVDSGAMKVLIERVKEAAADDRLPSAALVMVPAPTRPDVAEADPVAAASASSATPDEPEVGPELHSILSAAPVPLPADVVGAPSLAAYRGRAPRGGWEDLQVLLDTDVATLSGGLVRLRRRSGRPGVVRRADARALRDAVAEVLPEVDPVRGRLLAGLAAAGGGPTAAVFAIRAAVEALERGEAEAAEKLLVAAGPAAHAPLLRAQAARLRDDPVSAQRHAEAAVAAASGDDVLPALLEVALATWALGRGAQAQECFEALAVEAEAREADDFLGLARFSLGRVLEEEGDFVAAAKIHGDAAKAFDRASDDLQAARAFARRAVAMAKAGAPDRAVRELRLAMERASDLDDPRPAALDVRILVGVVFREAGSRDKARQALGLAADKANRHADPEREAEARLLSAQFHLEAIPVRGSERGEALQDGREAAESAIRIARGAGLVALEAAAEGVLGELSWRAEDWAGAGVSLDRQAALWGRARRPAKEVGVAIRRGRLAGRQGDWETAFRAAVAALTLASKRRLKEQAAQAQLLRGEALENLERGGEALDAFAEAQRIYSALGSSFEAQARAAEQRARQSIANRRA
jgi:tetratricopeptide (TPR) repeat protein